MARLFPFRSETAVEEGQPRIVDLEGEDADAVFAALSSTTARQIYARLDDEPGTPSDIADAIDSSIQNVRYHLENLEDAGLVDVIDTWYSSRGNEMSVYATTDGPLIVTSDESRATQLKEALSRFIGGVGALAGASLLIQYGLAWWFTRTETRSTTYGTQPAESDGTSTGGSENESQLSGRDSTDANSGGSSSAGDDGFSIDSVDETNNTGTETGDGSDGASDPALDAGNEGGQNVSNGTTDPALDAGNEGGQNVSNGTTDPALDAGNEGGQTVSNGGVEAAEAVFGTVPPGLLFFLGGLIVLLAVTVYWYWYRPAY
ncbi:ArsR/SmtB family transcription factor [Natrinema gelatinilyticum]|uniref:ArsR/SmtB family transcription factor n=1 Tax=Natrinema gelatinilyticum TaxID=2961571 RepID=UPI0020C4C237|nr:helix-turn-helix domain-containing protein [Natrinema gelatinilyticum]